MNLMRTEKEVNEGITIYYTDDKVIMVQDNYDHSLARIKSSLKYIKQWIKLPSLKDIDIEVLDKPKYARTVSIEFKTKENLDSIKESIPNKCFRLTEDSALWDWLNKC